MKKGIKSSAIMITLALSLGANAFDQNQNQGQDQQQSKGQAGQDSYESSKGEGQTFSAHLADHEIRHREHNQTTVEKVIDVTEATREEAWSSSDEEENLRVGNPKVKTWTTSPQQNKGFGKYNK